MKFDVAFNWMKRGHRMQAPGFKGYWECDPEGKDITIVTKNNERMDLRDSDNMGFTIGFIMSDEWTFYNGPTDPREQDYEV